MNKEEEKDKQCKVTFTFSLGPIGSFPSVTFRCMRDKHEDGKHEHHGISVKGWDYTVSWEEPKGATVDMDKAFIGKESRKTM